MTVTIRRAAWVAFLVGSALLQGCTERPAGTAASGARIYAADLAGGAKMCDVPSVSPTAGKLVDVAIKVGNDSGWCGIRVHQSGSKPFDAGLLTERPSHGTVTIHTVGDETRIDYVPDRGFAGSDGYTVKLLPGMAALQVAVTVIKP